ncbi:MAG: phage major capsid protein [Christensenellaceae bacterium]|nr:phage major capsid protein [Christensenellaceae bacterium]
MELKALREKRSGIIEEMTDLVNKASAETRSFTNEEQTAYDGYKAEVAAIDRTIAAAEEMRNEQRKLETPVETRDAGNNGSDKLTPEERSFVAYIRGMAAGRSGEMRADTNMTKGDNAAVIPQTVANKIVETVRDMCPIFDLATTYRVGGTLAIPYEDSSTRVTAGYADEFADSDSTAQKLTTITLTGFLLKAETKVSISLLKNTDLDLLNYVIRKVAESMVFAIEKEYLVGTTNKISGIAGTVKNKITAATATAVTTDELIDLQDSVPDVYQANAIWIMNGKTRTALRKLKDNEGKYLLNPDLTAKWGYKLLGKDVYVSDSMPTMAAGKLAIYYGDMSGLASKISEEIEVKVLNELYAKQHAVGILAFAEVDAKIENAQKIAALAMKAS